MAEWLRMLALMEYTQLQTLQGNDCLEYFSVNSPQTRKAPEVPSSALFKGVAVYRLIVLVKSSFRYKLCKSLLCRFWWLGSFVCKLYVQWGQQPYCSYVLAPTIFYSLNLITTTATGPNPIPQSPTSF